MSKEKRFVEIYKEGKITGAKILEDTETGIQYMFAFEGYAGGLTPLLDMDGNLKINKK